MMSPIGFAARMCHVAERWTSGRDGNIPDAHDVVRSECCSILHRCTLNILTKRADAMPEANTIREHMEIAGSDGVRVGTFDAVEDHRFKLAKQDSSDGQHRLSYAVLALMELEASYVLRRRRIG